MIGVLRNGHADWKVVETLKFVESDLRPKALADFIFTHPEIVWRMRQLLSLPECFLSLADILEDLPDDSAFSWNRERRDYLLNQMSESMLRN